MVTQGPGRIRLGVWLDGVELPAWLHAALAAVRDVEGVTFGHVFQDAAPPPRRALAELLFALYERLDRRAFASAPDALAPMDARPLLVGVETVRAQRSEAAQVLARAGLDVLLHLGSGRLPGAALGVPRLGVWSWSQLETARRGGAPLLTAVERAEPVCETALWILRPEPEPHRILARCLSSSDPNGRDRCEPVSLQRARAEAYWKSAAFPARVLGRMLAAGAGLPDGLPAADPVPDEDRAGALRTARLAALVLLRMIGRRWRYRRLDARWYLALRPRRPAVPGSSMDGFVRLPMPPDRFFADPFLVRHGDRDLLFYEDADRRSEIGRIACTELDAEGRPGRTAPVLEEEHHLSYPCVFAWQGEWWMIPESAAARRVALYRATPFPWRWTLERILFEGVRAADPTVHARDGRLWLFMNLAPEGASANDELFLFHASDPRGPWKPHPKNPVVSDVRCARPAGRLFEHEGQLYRPAQDCSETYGGALVLRRVELLDERGYHESTAARIGPEWQPGAIATHSLALSEAFEVVDVRILEPRA